MNKKKLIFLGLDVLVLVVTIGVSLAVFNYVKKGENPNIIKSGYITMNFVEGTRNINIPVIRPTEDEIGKTYGLEDIPEENKYCTNNSEEGIQCYSDFVVSTNMNLSYPISYEVTLEKDSELSTLEESGVRIYLEKYIVEDGESEEDKTYEEVFSPKEFTKIDSENPTGTDELGASNSEMLLDSGSVTKSVTYHYRLRMWLASDYTLSNESVTFSAKVNVYGSNVEVNATSGITLDKTNLTMQKGSTNTLTATIKPDNAKNKNLIWESSNSNVVKVDSVGNLTAIDIGTSVITVSTRDREYSATCIIKVVNYDAKGVTLNTNNVTLSKGNTYQLTSIVTPTDAEDTSVTYKSSSEGIATISNNGLITAVGVGETTIIVETINGYTDTCKVIVTEPNVTNISINGDDNVDVGSTIQLSTTITSDSLESSNVVWTSSDESKAIVSSTGKVTGISMGSVTITTYIKEYPDIKTTKTIEVEYPEIKSITMSSDMTINYGNTTTFSIWISPNQVRNQDKIRWTSSNTSVAIIPSTCNENLSCSPTIISDGSSTIKAVVIKIVDGEEVETSIFDTATLAVNINTVNLASYIESLWKKEGGVNASTIADTTILFSDSTSDNNIRYTGASPNNYVWFNNERWRIIGSFNNIKSSDSDNGETRVKIVRADSIGKFARDENDSNDWTISTLKNLINSSAYNYISNNMVENAYWNLGSFTDYNNITTQVSYVSERASNPPPGTTSYYWIGKVGLSYPSDIGYACYYCSAEKNLSKLNICVDNNWMSGEVNESLITSAGNTATRIYFNYLEGNVASWNRPNSSVDARPALYLKSNVVVKQDGADGSYEKPYNIALGS